MGFSDSWQNLVAMGQGTSKGIELLIQKNKGRATGWIAYTLSKAEREFSKESGINAGQKFPFLSDSIYASASFTAATVLIDCLSESCYRYLKMANGIVMGYYRDYDALIDPIKMPSNVHGDSGTIGIITRNSKRIVLYDHYRPKPVYAPDRRW